LLIIFPVPLACTSSLYSMPLINMFALLMESQCSCVFLLQPLRLLFKDSYVFSLIPILSLSPEILSSTYSNVLEWLLSVFLIWFKGLFISRIFCLILFSETFHIFVKLLFLSYLYES
jgi:hypothetical protein